jgi:hypothetical protein
MEINELNLLALPLSSVFNPETKETIISLSLGIQSDHELGGEELWEAKKAFARQLKHISDQLIG